MTQDEEQKGGRGLDDVSSTCCPNQTSVPQLGEGHVQDSGGSEGDECEAQRQNQCVSGFCKHGFRKAPRRKGERVDLAVSPHGSLCLGGFVLPYAATFPLSWDS